MRTPARIAFPECIPLLVNRSGKPVNEHKRLESAGTVREIDRYDLEDRKACDGCSLSFELDEVGDANREIVTGCLAYGLVPPPFFPCPMQTLRSLNQGSLSVRFFGSPYFIQCIERSIQ